MDYFENMSGSRKELWALLEQKNFTCIAPTREFINDKFKVLGPRDVYFSPDVIKEAEKLGGLEPGMTFDYPNAQGGISTARVCSLYDLPKDMVKPYVCILGGHMLAPFYALEILRFYAKQTGIVLPSVTTGKEGNKGLFKKLFYRKSGLIIRTEYYAYSKVLSLLTSDEYAFANYKECEDTDTEGNLVELYLFAKEKDLKEITLVLCTGNPFYDKRLLAEWMYQLRQEKFADVKVNLVCAHCPVFYSLTKMSLYMPEARISEIFNGYLSASIGPLYKDTITFEGQKNSARPERYLMPGVKEADWEMFKPYIVDYSNMGWNNYQELLYGIPHEEAVMNVIISDLFAQASYTPEDYDYGMICYMNRYQRFLGGACGADQPLLDYLVKTNDTKFFEPKRPDHMYTD